MLTWVEIDTNAVRRNIDTLRSVLPAHTGVMAVIKANAYGHGLEVVAPAVAERSEWLGVNTVDEAMAVRKLGIGKPVAILGHTEREQLGTVVANEFRQVAYREDIAAELSRCAVAASRTGYLHLKVETGTHRQGIPLAELPHFLARIAGLPNLKIEGVYTHFANIEDTLEPSFALLQLSRFRDAILILNAAGLQPVYAHAAATAGALLYPEAGFGMVRLGIGIYGIWPSRETQLAARERGRRISLAPALTWKTRIAQIKTIEAGDYVGYGLTYQASRRMKIAILPLGYFDGYDRRLSNCGRTLAGGRIAPVVGRVAMNMTAIDITDTDAALDDEVVLIGRQGSLEIRVEELAEKIGTISYEVVSRINPYIPRLEAS
jgi:alanine racemase